MGVEYFNYNGVGHDFDNDLFMRSLLFWCHNQLNIQTCIIMNLRNGHRTRLPSSFVQESGENNLNIIFTKHGDINIILC